MNSYVAWFAKNPVAANLLMLVIVLSGVLALMFQLKYEVFPDTALDIVRVEVVYPGSTPAEIEQGVSIPIEEAIADIQGIKKITSTAAENIGAVTLELMPGFNTKQVLDQVKVRVDAIDTFPERAEKPVIEELMIRRQVLGVVVSGQTDEKTLRRITENVRDQIAALPGISLATLSNVRQYEIAIEVSEEALRRHQLTFADVARAIRNSSIELSGGNVKTSAGEILLRTASRAYTGPEFERIVLLTKEDGSRVRIGDVATVIDGFEETPLTSTFNGEPAAIVNVFRVGDQSALKVSRIIRDWLPEARRQMPEGISLSIWRDSSVILWDRLSLLVRNAGGGLLLVFIVLALFLRFSLAIWVTLGIPISLLGAFAVMPFVGVSVNMISLFALILVLGIVVDDAIVVGENIYTHSKKEGAGLNAAVTGTVEVAIPVVFAVLTTMAAFAPMLAIPGVNGKIWGVIPLTVIPCLAFSLIESQLILPAHLSHIRASKGDERSAFFFVNWWRALRVRTSTGLERFVDYYYRRWIFFASENRYAMLFAFIAFFILTIGLVFTGIVKWEFFPKVPNDYVVAKLEMPIGTPVDKTREGVDQLFNAAQQVQQEYAEGQGLEDEEGKIFKAKQTTIGMQPFTGFFEANLASVQSHLGEVAIELTPTQDRTISSSAVEARWRELTGQVPGAVELTFDSTITQVGKAVDVQFSGPSLESLQQASIELKDELAKVKGVFEINDTFREGKLEIRPRITPEGELVGLREQDIGEQVRQAFYGEEAQRIQRGRDEIKVLVRLPYEERSTLEGLNDLRIRTGDGAEVPFSTVADASIGRSPATITRVDRRRAVNVTADIDNKQSSQREVIGELTDRVLPGILSKHPGVTYTFEGEQREQTETIGGLMTGAVLALFGIYALMAIPFRSYLQPLVIMSVIPFSLTGAIWGHVIMSGIGQFYGATYNISMLSVCGMIALAGVVVNDGLVLIDYINKNRRKGLPLGMSVRRAGAARFRAILLTSLTTFAGLLPLLMERSLQAQFLIPMAISLAFGILFGTILNLILTPCVYLIVEDLVLATTWFFTGKATGTVDMTAVEEEMEYQLHQRDEALFPGLKR